MAMLSWGCKKERFDTAAGFVVDTGTFNSGGCQWMIELPTLPVTLLEPVNLPAEFKVDGLPVRIDYKVLEQTPVCSTLKGVEGQINLHKIETIQ